MTRSRPHFSLAGLLAIFVSLSIACGGGSSDEVHATVATARSLRGPLGAEGDALLARRLGVDESLAMAEGSLSFLVLDSGPRLLLSGAEAAVDEAGALRLSGITAQSGRAFVDVAPGDALELHVDVGGDAPSVVRLSNAAISIEPGLRLYVIRGEASVSRGEGSASVATGESLALDDAEASATGETLWDDWTGGLAEAASAAVGGSGMGSLEARLPGEIGSARWPLVVRRLDVKVTIRGDLAITEVEQQFFNPASETVEGIYRVRVPETAALQRFAVDRNGRLVDGYIKEKAQAARQYQRQVYRGSRLDPALLEWVAPGRYQAKIYPIDAGSTRRIAIRYAEWLRRPGEGAPRVYRYPMGAGLGANAPEIADLSVEVDLREARAGEVRAGHGATVDEGRVVLRRSDFRPRSDFFVELLDGAETPRRNLAYRAAHVAPMRDPSAPVSNLGAEDDYVFFPIVLPNEIYAPASEGGLDVVLVADVSAATEGTHLELGRSVVESLATHLGPDDRVAIVASDLSLRPVTEDAPALGPASPDRVEALLDGLARTPHGGASDLGAALVAASELLDPARPGVVVYVGDGAPTVGEIEAQGLLERLARLPRPLRAYAVAVGNDANLGLLENVTRGAGLARRVESRVEGAEAALEVLAHARRPIAENVEIEVTGLEQVFPRGAVAVPRGEPLNLVARLDAGSREAPRSLVVRGTVAGEAFERRVEFDTETISDGADLRLRWASERLRQLLLSGEGRQEIADLGTRYGLITPFTSFYVPSAAEISRLGDDALPLLDQRYAAATQAGANPLLLPFALSGCSLGDRNESPSATSRGFSAGDYEADESEMMEEASEEGAMGEENAPRTQNRYAIEGPGEPEPEAVAPAAPMPSGGTGAVADAPAVAGAMAPAGAMPAPVQQPMARSASRSRRSGGASPNNDPLSGLDFGGGGLGMNGNGGEGEQGSERQRPRRERSARIGARHAATTESLDEDRSVAQEAGILDQLQALGYATGASGGDGRAGRRDAGEVTLGTLAGRDGDLRLDVQTTVTISRRPGHDRRRCSDASHASLDDRAELWRERLGRTGAHSAWWREYRRAVASCELPSWRDRRRFLGLMLAQAGSVPSMIALYHSTSSSSFRRYFRRAILRRVRTPADLRAVRAAFGPRVDQEIIDRELARATTDAAKVRVLRRLVARFPMHMELQLQLLELLEKLERIPEARRLAHSMRQNPLADAGVRTAIGEMFLRLEDEPEARRVFSEIVEFAPRDELARRRLGDLYRAHGWFEDAYRQYQTLARIRPDDPSVNLLLAQAAAGAGRIDEALRLERSLAQTERAGEAVGMARTALLWSSVRYAELRQQAREDSDEEQLATLRNRMRTSGVLGMASPLRASLVWSHPDADLALYGGFPGLGLSRPQDLSPEYGIEVFDVPEVEDGVYRVEIRRRSERGERHLGRVRAKLIVVWREGESDERVEVRELEFEGSTRALAFAIEGDEMSEATPSTLGRRGGAR